MMTRHVAPSTVNGDVVHLDQMQFVARTMNIVVPLEPFVMWIKVFVTRNLILIFHNVLSCVGFDIGKNKIKLVTKIGVNLRYCFYFNQLP